jgi:hypothetical protein
MEDAGFKKVSTARRISFVNESQNYDSHRVPSIEQRHNAEA